MRSSIPVQRALVLYCASIGPLARALILIALAALFAGLAQAETPTPEASAWSPARELELARSLWPSSPEDSEDAAAVHLFKALLLDAPLEHEDYRRLDSLDPDREAALWGRVLVEAESGAHRGLAAAQFALARALENPRPGAMDSERALDLYLRAAQKGHVGASGRAGMMLLDGRGGARDERRGYQLLLRAADSGDRHALGRLAERTLTGGGVLKSPQKAIALYMAAADAGDFWATHFLLTSCTHSYYERYGLSCTQEDLVAWGRTARRFAPGSDELAVLAEVIDELEEVHPGLAVEISNIDGKRE